MFQVKVLKKYKTKILIKMNFHHKSGEKNLSFFEKYKTSFHPSVSSRVEDIEYKTGIVMVTSPVFYIQQA